jgi:hypothetical protein
MGMNPKLCDVTVQVLRNHPNDNAVLIADGDKEVWIPRSMCELHHLKDDLYEMTLPEWKAKQEGLI